MSLLEEVSDDSYRAKIGESVDRIKFRNASDYRALFFKRWCVLVSKLFHGVGKESQPHSSKCNNFYIKMTDMSQLTAVIYMIV